MPAPPSQVARSSFPAPSLKFPTFSTRWPGLSLMVTSKLPLRMCYLCLRKFHVCVASLMSPLMLGPSIPSAFVTLQPLIQAQVEDNCSKHAPLLHDVHFPTGTLPEYVYACGDFPLYKRCDMALFVPCLGLSLLLASGSSRAGDTCPHQAGIFEWCAPTPRRWSQPCQARGQ